MSSSGRGEPWLRRNLRYIGVAVSLTLFGAALLALHHILTEVHLADVFARFRETPWTSVSLSLACVTGGYLALTGYDVLALRYLGKPLPYAKAALASFTSYTFSHNIGLSLITGGSIRYRIYSAVGLSATEIATLTGICALTFGLGVSLLLGLALLLEPAALGAADALSPVANRALGVAILVAVAAYAAASGIRTQPFQLKGWLVRLPSLSVTLRQLALGAIDISLAAAALYVVLPADVPMGFPAFVGIYVAAVTIGVLSHAPGGLGVFEAVMLLALPAVEPGALFGSLLVYRCLYYFLPFALAAVLLSWHEFTLRREAFGPSVRAARDVVHAVAPPVLGAAVFAGGAVLLFSAAMPAVQARMSVLRDILPLPFIEASHLLSSVVGLWLMILARGLFRRLDGAFHLTVAVLAAGILFSLLKGFDYEEALILGFVLVLLFASRSAFYRKASLLNEPFSTSWIVTIAATIVSSIWLGTFAFKHVDFSNALWWEFAFRGDAPRFLRASVAVTVLALALVVFSLLRPAAPRASAAAPARETIVRILAHAPRADAHLALTGDKRFCMSDAGDGFIMYQVHGRSWVALGDPVGPQSAWGPLLWRFREISDRHAGWPVFYQIGGESLPFYLDLGLSFLKLGEEGRVRLDQFSLTGGKRRDLRHAERRAAKDGAVFAVVPAREVAAILPKLRAISDAWLSEKNTHEKGFSVGSFSEAYLTNCDCAVVRRGGEIVAFANILYAPAGGEFTVDLVRHRSDAPYGIMDYLFVHLMLWGRDQGYRWFNLGMAPLSGLEHHPLAPVWNRVGTFVFRHGEHFYNFEGLRAYKEKFDPVWTPKYLAAPGGLALPRILLDVAALIAGGAKQLFTR